MPIGGGKATALTQGMGFDAQPRFSPDGKKIVYVSDRDGGYNLYILSLDKKDTTQLTTGKTNRYYSPVFTPDGKYVIATRGTRLYIYDIEGGTGEELVRPDPNAAAAAAGRGGAPGADALRQMGAAFGKDPRYVWFAQRRGTFHVQHAASGLFARRLRSRVRYDDDRANALGVGVPSGALARR